MEAIIKKWGNSPALRLNATIMKSAHLSLEQRVSIKVKRGRIIIEPITQNEYSLEELVDGIKASNLHEEADFGSPAGKELL